MHMFLGKGSYGPLFMIFTCHLILHLLVRIMYEGCSEILHALPSFSRVRVCPNKLDINMVTYWYFQMMFRFTHHLYILAYVNSSKLIAPVAEKLLKLLRDRISSTTYVIDQAILANTKLDHGCLLSPAWRSKLEVSSYNLLLRSSKWWFNPVDPRISGCRKVGVDCRDGDTFMSRDIKGDSEWIYGHWKNRGEIGRGGWRITHSWNRGENI